MRPTPKRHAATIAPELAYEYRGEQRRPVARWRVRCACCPTAGPFRRRVEAETWMAGHDTVAMALA